MTILVLDTSNSRGAVDREFVYIELETSFSPLFSFFVLFFCLSLFLPSFWCLLCRSCEERQLWCSLVWPTEEFCTPHCLTPLILLLSLFIYHYNCYYYYDLSTRNQHHLAVEILYEMNAIQLLGCSQHIRFLSAGPGRERLGIEKSLISINPSCRGAGAIFWA